MDSGQLASFKKPADQILHRFRMDINWFSRTAVELFTQGELLVI